MKISLEWLSDYVDIDKSANEIAQILSDLGFPTEGIEKIGADTVIDVEVSSNRGDCLSHIGVARELAAAAGKELRLPKVELPESKEDTAKFVEVSIEAPNLCGRYTARIITGIKVGPSPDWMKKRNSIPNSSSFTMHWTRAITSRARWATR